jgi:hypothetical protein
MAYRRDEHSPEFVFMSSYVSREMSKFCGMPALVQSDILLEPTPAVGVASADLNFEAWRGTDGAVLHRA